MEEKQKEKSKEKVKDKSKEKLKEKTKEQKDNAKDLKDEVLLASQEQQLEDKELDLQHPDYQQEIVKIIKSKMSPKMLRDRLSEYHESDISKTLDLLTKEERAKLYHVLDIESLSAILEYVSDDIGKYFSEISTKQKIDILSNLEPDTASEYLMSLDESERKILVDLMDDESKKEILLLASFSDDEIGSKMSTDFIVIKDNISIKVAMKEMVKQAAEIDNIQTIYVVDAKDQTFCGAINLTDLIRAREESKLDDLIISSYPYVYAEESIEDCIEDLKQYNEDSIPVLDNNNKIIGVITSNDLVQVVNEELSEDYVKFAGLTNEEDLHEPLKDSISKRLPWLIILLFLGMIVSSVVGTFEIVVTIIPLLLCFQSLILDMAGNVGTQSLAVTIRVLMDETLSGKDKFMLVTKEARVGFINGLILAIVSFVFSGAYIVYVKHLGVNQSFLISFCISIALLLSMTLSSIMGTIIPMFFKKLNFDPAVVSGPLITTINDLVAVCTYYGMSYLLLVQVFQVYTLP